MRVITSTIYKQPQQQSLFYGLAAAGSLLTRANRAKLHIAKLFTRQLNIKRKIAPVPESASKLPVRFNMEWPKITLFGDSITRRSTDPDNGCWASYINYKVGDYFDVDARGFEGYNSKWGLELMPKLFPKSYLDRVEVFIPFFGHNDSFCPPSPLHTPVDQYETNMRAIIGYLLENGLSRDKILMITPTWYHKESFLNWLKSVGLPPTYKKLEIAQLYSESVLRIATSENIEVLDFFDYTTKYAKPEELFCDGIHFSRVGAKVLADLLMPKIEKKIQSSFGRPLSELRHAVTWDEIPEVKRWIQDYARDSNQK